MSDTVQNIMTQTLADPVVFKCLECGPAHPNPWLVPKCPNCGGNSWAAPSSMIVNILARSMNRTLPLHRQSAYAQSVVNAQQSASHLLSQSARSTRISRRSSAQHSNVFRCQAEPGLQLDVIEVEEPHADALLSRIVPSPNKSANEARRHGKAR